MAQSSGLGCAPSVTSISRGSGRTPHLPGNQDAASKERLQKPGPGHSALRLRSYQVPNAVGLRPASIKWTLSFTREPRGTWRGTTKSTSARARLPQERVSARQPSVECRRATWSTDMGRQSEGRSGKRSCWEDDEGNGVGGRGNSLCKGSEQETPAAPLSSQGSGEIVGGQPWARHTAVAAGGVGAGPCQVDFLQRSCWLCSRVRQRSGKRAAETPLRCPGLGLGFSF